MSAYRSSYEHIIGARLGAMRQARATMESKLPQLRSVRNARIARMVSGVVGVLGACAMAIACAVDSSGPLPTELLLGSGVFTVLTYLCVRAGLVLAPLAPKAWGPPRLTGRLEEDLVLLEASDTTTMMGGRLAKLEVPSMILPMAAVTLLTPLTLHWLFTACCDSGTFQSFSWWIAASLIIVGHAHLALIVLAYYFVRKMKRASTEEVKALSIHQEWGKALGITIVVSAVPGIVLIAVPPILSAATGLAFVPLMFWAAREYVIRERAKLTIEAADAPAFIRIEAGDVQPLEDMLVEEQRAVSAMAS